VGLCSRRSLAPSSQNPIFLPCPAPDSLSRLRLLHMLDISKLLKRKSLKNHVLLHIIQMCNGVTADWYSRFAGTWHYVPRAGGWGLLSEDLGWVCGTPLETLTLFQTKICDFPYPISGLTQNLTLYFRHDPNPISFAFFLRKYS